MKTTLKIAAIFCLAISLNSCSLFGGGKSKCGDCPTWSQHSDSPKDGVIEQKRA